MSIPLLVLGYVAGKMLCGVAARQPTRTRALDGLFKAAAALTADAAFATALGEPAYITLSLFALAAVCLAGWHAVLAHTPPDTTREAAAA